MILYIILVKWYHFINKLQTSMVNPIDKFKSWICVKLSREFEPIGATLNFSLINSSWTFFFFNGNRIKRSSELTGFVLPLHKICIHNVYGLKMLLMLWGWSVWYLPHFSPWWAVLKPDLGIVLMSKQTWVDFLGFNFTADCRNFYWIGPLPMKSKWPSI